jgi:hypothetical protein
MRALDEIRAELAGRRLQSGGWSSLAQGLQTALEPTCLALLALSFQAGPHTLEPLLRLERRDGSWRAFEGDEEGSGLTSLALLTLNLLGARRDSQHRAVDWLLSTRGREASWPWSWKFRSRDTQARFDPAKFGWPWHPGTCSWVVPTSFALLALKYTLPSHASRNVAQRVRRAAEMLHDRACPGGGWNAGNGIVYGRPMAPHVDSTAIALLALQNEPPSEIIESSLTWLDRNAHSCRAVWSLAWSALALDAYRHDAGALIKCLAALVEPQETSDTATLAIAALALECPGRGNIFEVEG